MEADKTLSYADYQRLKSAKLELWSESDIARFLVLDCFVTPHEVAWAKDIQKTYVQEWQSMAEKYNQWKFVFEISDWFFLTFYLLSKRSGKKNMLFHNARYESIILEAKKHYHLGLIVEGKKDRVFAAKNFMGYMGLNSLNKYLVSY